MKTRRLIAFCLVLLFSLTGCQPETPVEDDAVAQDDTAQEDIVYPVVLPEEQDWTQIEGSDEIVSIVPGENGEYFTAPVYGTVSRWAADGTLLEEYPNSLYMRNICYQDGYVYGFQSIKRDILRLDPKSGEVVILYAELDLTLINGMTVREGIIWLVGEKYLSENGDLASGGEYERIFLRIDPVTRECVQIDEIEEPLYLYAASDGEVYIYAYPDKEYTLYQYNVKTGTAEQIAVYETGIVHGTILYEEGTLLCTRTNARIQAIRTEDSLTYVVPGTKAASGGNFFVQNGTIYCLTNEESENPTDRLQAIEIDNGIAAGISTDPNAADFRGIITIAHGNDLIEDMPYINAEEVYRRSGIQGIVLQATGTGLEREDAEDDYITSLLAGDSTADIYIVKSYYSNIPSFLENAGYVPLNESEAITDFLDGCFPWVEDAVTLDSGEIAMYPLWFDLPGVWYSEELFTQFGLTPEDFATFDSMLEAHRRILEEKGDYMTQIHYQDTYWNALRQYESLYCDYENGIAEFDTELFTELFDLLFTGWNVSAGECHPVLEYDDAALWTSPEAQKALAKRGYYYPIFEYYPEITIYCVQRSRMYLGLERQLSRFDKPQEAIPTLEDWRVLPMPVIHEDVESGICTEATFAVINPHSKNRELAIEYLETISRDFIGCTNFVLFIQEDMAVYEDYYDLSQPVYQDIYRLFQNAQAQLIRFPVSEIRGPMQDYQLGRMTLEEAVAEIDRRAKIYAGE